MSLSIVMHVNTKLLTLQYKIKNMDNKELAKELLGYTYIDMQKIPEIYELLEVNIKEFNKYYENEDYEAALSSLMDNKAAHVLFYFLMNPMNRLKNLAK